MYVLDVVAEFLPYYFSGQFESSTSGSDIFDVLNRSVTTDSRNCEPNQQQQQQQQQKVFDQSMLGDVFAQPPLSQVRRRAQIVFFFVLHSVLLFKFLTLIFIFICCGRQNSEMSDGSQQTLLAKLLSSNEADSANLDSFTM